MAGMAAFSWAKCQAASLVQPRNFDGFSHDPRPASHDDTQLSAKAGGACWGLCGAYSLVVQNRNTAWLSTVQHYIHDILHIPMTVPR